MMIKPSMVLWRPSPNLNVWLQHGKYCRQPSIVPRRHYALKQEGIKPIDEFRKRLDDAKKIVVLTGAGMSIECGIPSAFDFRVYRTKELSNPNTFQRNPALVWEFYQYRRTTILKNAHITEAQSALVDFQNRRHSDVSLITMNVDGLHQRFGAKNVLELHGSLFKTKCTNCGEVSENHQDPIVPAFSDKGSPDPSIPDPEIPLNELPACTSCGGLLRPAATMFGEALDPDVLERAEEAFDNCSACIVIGASSVTHPGSMFAPPAARRGAIVAEINLDVTPATGIYSYHFHGAASDILPHILAER